MKIEIPKNTYSVEADPAVAEVVKKVVDRLTTCDEVDVLRHPYNEACRRSNLCVDNDATGYEICNRFVKAGYHAAAAVYCGIVQRFLISKKPVDRCFERIIIG